MQDTTRTVKPQQRSKGTSRIAGASSGPLRAVLGWVFSLSASSACHCRMCSMPRPACGESYVWLGIFELDEEIPQCRADPLRKFATHHLQLQPVPLTQGVGRGVGGLHLRRRHGRDIGGGYREVAVIAADAVTQRRRGWKSLPGHDAPPYAGWQTMCAGNCVTAVATSPRVTSRAP